MYLQTYSVEDARLVSTLGVETQIFTALVGGSLGFILGFSKPGLRFQFPR